MLIELAVTGSLTFLLGYLFSRQALKPAEETLERLENFTASSSHELKTPITVAMSNIELALKTKQYEKYLQQTKQGLKQAANLVTKLLELTQINSSIVEKTTFDLCELIQDIGKYHQSLSQGKGLNVRTNLPNSYQLVADFDLTQSCLNNLYENAVKYAPEGGWVTINLGQNRLVFSNNTHSQLKGENLQRLFDPFFKLNSSGQTEGYGVGLSIVKSICEVHGWEITVNATENTVSFSIKLK